MSLTDAEREWVAHMLEDALMPYGREFNAGDAARLIEARLETLLRKARADAWDEGHRTPRPNQRQLALLLRDVHEELRLAGFTEGHRNAVLDCISLALDEWPDRRAAPRVAKESRAPWPHSFMAVTDCGICGMSPDEENHHDPNLIAPEDR